MSDENPATPSATFTPQMMLGDLLFDELPSLEAVVTKATDFPGDLGVTAEPVAGQEGVIEVHIAQFGASAVLTLIDAPVPGGEAEANAHQLYCQGQERENIAAHRAQILVAVRPEFTGGTAAQAGDLPARQVQLATARVLGMVTMALSRLPGLVGYYSGTAAATYGLTFVQQVMTGQFGSTPWPLWISAWLRPGPDGFSAHTYGLWTMGHPELQVENTSTTPENLFMFLMDTAAYVILEGEELADGQTTGRSAEELFTLHAEPWVVDPESPALRVGM